MKHRLFVLLALLSLVASCQTFWTGWTVPYNDLILSTEREAVVLPGTDIVSVRVIEESAAMNRYEIAIVLTKQGTALFARVTERAVGQQLSISAGGKLLLAPIIMAPIPDGRITVTGYSRQEAQRIVDQFVKK